MNRLVLAPYGVENSNLSLTGGRFLLFLMLETPFPPFEVCPDPAADFLQKVVCPWFPRGVVLHGVAVVYPNRLRLRWEIPREVCGLAVVQPTVWR
jgi:hypothetical protein